MGNICAGQQLSDEELANRWEDVRSIKILKTGYFQKVGKINKELRRRFFVLLPDFTLMIYFATQDDWQKMLDFPRKNNVALQSANDWVEKGVSKFARGVILLGETVFLRSTIPRPSSLNIGDRSFGLQLPDRTYELLFQTPEGCEEWRAAIKQSCKGPPRDRRLTDRLSHFEDRDDQEALEEKMKGMDLTSVHKLSQLSTVSAGGSMAGYDDDDYRMSVN